MNYVSCIGKLKEFIPNKDILKLSVERIDIDKEDVITFSINEDMSKWLKDKVELCDLIDVKGRIENEDDKLKIIVNNISLISKKKEDDE